MSDSILMFLLMGLSRTAHIIIIDALEGKVYPSMVRDEAIHGLGCQVASRKVISVAFKKIDLQNTFVVTVG